MVPACIRCGSPLAGGRFCPSCGIRQPDHSRETDPYVGRLIDDRYEVGELICVGGMGRIHRGLQVSLDRPVAIKFIHPHLSTSPDAVQRFLLEARAASRLNHPNVVHVLDFGRTPEADGGDLYMVMELLAGSDLGRVLEREGALPYPRAAAIVRQVLGALAEAHHHGIVHRDVKPENVVVERLRERADHVKVIDFGIASMGAGRITLAGEVVGTVGYMAPEHASGQPTGPSADLYAVGVILFELLSARLPYEDLSVHRVLEQQRSGPAPDVRALAPDKRIPEAVARVVARALEADPARRFPDAAAFAEALGHAAGVAEPGRVSSRETDTVHTAPTAPRVPAVQPVPRAALPDTQPAAVDPHALPPAEGPLFGRDEVVEAAARALDGEARALVIWGRAGAGRSRVLREVARACVARGSVAVLLEADPTPRGGVTYGGLQSAVAALASVPPGDAWLATGAAAGDGEAGDALRALFGEGPPGVARPPESCAPALAWAAERAARNAPGGRVVLAVDDLDQLDAPSRRALAWVLEHRPLPGFALLATRATPPTAARDGVRVIPLRGLRPDEARRWLTRRGIAPARLPANLGDEVEPALLEQWCRTGARIDVTVGLDALLAARVAALPRAQSYALAALAVLGTATPAEAGAVMPDAGCAAQVAASLAALETAGLVRRRGGERVSCVHAAVTVAARAAVGDVVLAEMHARAFVALCRPGASPVEERAHHALRGQADFEAFFLAEMAASMREAAGDDEGAAAMLTDAVLAAQALCARGEVDEGSSAWLVLGRKLADALLRTGRADAAAGVLAELLGVPGHTERSRALLLERLATTAYARGQREEGDRRFREACEAAGRSGDAELLARVSEGRAAAERCPPVRGASIPPATALAL